MYSDENKALSLAKFLNDFDYAIIDTCSLMEDSFPIWMDTLQNAQTYLKDSGNDVCIPDECLEELKKHSENKDNFDKNAAAKRALKIIRHAKWKKILTVVKTYGNDGERHFADKAIYVKVSSDRMSKKILVITQDRKLASDLRGLNKLISQYGHPVKVYRLDARGELIPNKGETSFQEEQIYKSYNNRINSFKKNSTKTPKEPFPRENHNNLDKVKTDDARLSTALKNDNYPDNKKIQDIEAQLKLLKSVPTEKKSGLLLDEDKLNNELKVLKDKNNSNLASIKETSPKETDYASLKKTMHYGTASSLKDAISSAATYTNIMFRFHSIPYMEQFHGKADVTDLDLNEIINLLEKDKNKNGFSVARHKGLIVLAEPNGNGFKAWVDVEKVVKPNGNELLASKKQANKFNGKKALSNGELAARQSSAFNKKEEKTSNVKSRKKVVKTQKVKNNQPLKEDKPKTTSKEKSVITPSDNFSHPKLVILAPESKTKREKIENRVRYEDSAPFKSSKKAKSNSGSGHNSSRSEVKNQPKKKTIVKKKVVKQTVKTNDKAQSKNDKAATSSNVNKVVTKPSVAKQANTNKSVHSSNQNVSNNKNASAKPTQNSVNKKKIVSKPKKIRRPAPPKKEN